MNIKPYYDIVIIGGGINGVGTALDAAGRGLKVLLCEQGDLANGTSSASSKLIHGGLRYLEHGQFGMVRKSLKERNILLRNAPGLVQPLEFVIPIHPRLRHPWIMRLGLMLYDLMAWPNQLKRSKVITLQNTLKEIFKKGFIYTDSRTEDARLVILNAIRAREKGAEIVTRTKCVKAFRENDHWHIELENNQRTSAKALINTSGPWLQAVIENTLAQKCEHPLQLVKGSHIIVPKLYDGEHAYLLQNFDNRVIFTIPYLEEYTLIGTTDEDFAGDPQAVSITEQEIDYLCTVVNEYFKTPITPENIVHTWSGVRPLVDGNNKHFSAMKRDYKIQLEIKNNLPLINLYGGKLTTYRLVAEKIVNALTPFFPDCRQAWTENNPLLSPALPNQNDYPWLESTVFSRLCQNYGSLCFKILEGANKLADMGQHFGHGLYEKEIRYLIQHEWAQTAQDILWRRTKLGFKFNRTACLLLEDYVRMLCSNYRVYQI